MLILEKWLLYKILELKFLIEVTGINPKWPKESALPFIVAVNKYSGSLQTQLPFMSYRCVVKYIHSKLQRYRCSADICIYCF
jgi:hypothetical protein